MKLSLHLHRHPHILDRFCGSLRPPLQRTASGLHGMDSSLGKSSRLASSFEMDVCLSKQQVRGFCVTRFACVGELVDRWCSPHYYHRRSYISHISRRCGPVLPLIWKCPFNSPFLPSCMFCGYVEVGRTRLLFPFTDLHGKKAPHIRPDTSFMFAL